MLSPFQKKIAAAALTCVSALVIGAFIVFLFMLLSKALSAFGTVIWPLVTACILTIIFRPVVTFICGKTKLSAPLATALVFALIVCGCTAGVLIIIPLLITQITMLIADFPDFAKNAVDFIGKYLPSIKQQIADAVDLQNISKDTVGIAAKGALNFLTAALAATSGVVHFFAAVAAFAVAPIYLYYMLSSKYDAFAAFKNNISFLPEKWRDDIVFLIKQFTMIMTAFFRGQILIAFIMGILLGTGFWIAGLKFGFLIGFCAGFLNVIPYFGTMLGLGVALPTAFFQTEGGLILLAVVLAIFAAVQMLEGYVLTPKIMGGNTGLHPGVIIFSVFFWGIALNGILGMILAIPLSAFIVVFWRLLLEKYLNKTPLKN